MPRKAAPVADALPTLLAPIRLPVAGNGGDVRLGSLWDGLPAVLVFLRHYGCINCRDNVARLTAHAQEFLAAGARLVAIGLGDLAAAAAFRDETALPFPLLVDDERRAYRTVRLRRASPFQVLYPSVLRSRRRARAAGLRAHRWGRHPLQLGGSFVFAPGNVQRLAHINRTFADDAPPGALLAAVRGA